MTTATATTATATPTSAYHQLFLDRCIETQAGGIKPTFWNPLPISEEPLCLYGDEDSQVLPEWNCDRAIRRLIALGLELELEVGEFVREASTKDLPGDLYLRKLLQTNIADEAKHFKGFSYAAKAYNVDSEKLEASSLRNYWQTLANKHHPLLIAMALEIGVFLPFLGCSRLFGGKSIATLSRKIAEDEFRHVITNRTLLDDLGIDCWNLPGDVNKAIAETISWGLNGLAIPESELDEDFNLDFVLRASRELVKTGQAEDYNDLVYMADHVLPFEVSNVSQYDRSFE